MAGVTLVKPWRWMHLEAKRLTEKYRPSKMFLLPISYSIFEVKSRQFRWQSMKTPVFLSFFRVSLLAFAIAGSFLGAFGQGSEPQRTQLLNGLRVVHLQKPGDQNV